MAYTTNSLISDAYYKSGVRSRDFQTPSGADISVGLNLLNEILTDKTVDNSMIPFESTYAFNATIDDDSYPIANLVSIDTFTFFINGVRFATKYSERNEFFGTGRPTNVQSLPFEWYFERGLGGGTLHVYFKPDQAFPLEIHGVFRLSEVALGQDLSLTIDTFYRSYLKYELAAAICTEFNYGVPAGVSSKLAEYRSWIAKNSRKLDLTMQKRSTLSTGYFLNYAWINFGGGWIP